MADRVSQRALGWTYTVLAVGSAAITVVADSSAFMTVVNVVLTVATGVTAFKAFAAEPDDHTRTADDVAVSGNPARWAGLPSWSQWALAVSMLAVLVVFTAKHLNVPTAHLAAALAFQIFDWVARALRRDCYDVDVDDE